MKVLRLFEIRGKELYILFYKLDIGTRLVPRGIWLSAKSRKVRDGSGGKWYDSGFHVFHKDSDPEYFMKRNRFRRPRKIAIVEVEVKKLNPKPTNPNVLLAKHMKVPKSGGIKKVVEIE